MSKKITSGMMKSATEGNQYPKQTLPESKNPQRYQDASASGKLIKTPKVKGERANDQR